MRKYLFILLPFFLCFSLAATATSAQSKWRKVNPGWKISCGVDAGAIRRKGKSYTFSTSRNQCVSRGTFTQRSEIYGSDISISKPMNYLFSTTIQLEASSKQSFTMFQIHDGRGSCSPPLKLDWHSDNRMRFRSSYSLDKGVSDCVYNKSMISARYTGPQLRRDGTQYRLQVLLEFDGAAGFTSTVFLNEKKVMTGTYLPSNDPRFFKSKKYYMKHGIYSRDMWNYQFNSMDIKVLRQKP